MVNISSDSAFSLDSPSTGLDVTNCSSSDYFSFNSWICFYFSQTQNWSTALIHWFVLTATMARILCTETIETAKEQGTKFSELLSELSLSMNTLKEADILKDV